MRSVKDLNILYFKNVQLKAIKLNLYNIFRFDYLTQKFQKL